MLKNETRTGSMWVFIIFFFFFFNTIKALIHIVRRVSIKQYKILHISQCPPATRFQLKKERNKDT